MLYPVRKTTLVPYLVSRLVFFCEDKARQHDAFVGSLKDATYDSNGRDTSGM